jgi:hypothetical protein
MKLFPAQCFHEIDLMASMLQYHLPYLVATLRLFGI